MPKSSKKVRARTDKKVSYDKVDCCLRWIAAPHLPPSGSRYKTNHPNSAIL